MSWKDFDLADLVMRALLIGHWKNVEDVEENLSLPELIALLRAHADQEFAHKKFAAALKGIELPDPAQEAAPTFEEIKERANKRIMAARTGLSEQAVEFNLLGIEYEG